MENKPPHMTPMEMAELLKAVSQGDERAFAGLVSQFADTIYSQCLAYVKSVEKAEELSQDIFMEVWAVSSPKIRYIQKYKILHF